jgi:TonB-dependent receptor
VNVAANTLGGDYTGDQRINAGFAMLDMPVGKKLRLVGGARFEAARMNVTNGMESGFLHDNDWLPSINATYQFDRQVNIRAAYGRTLARPSFREKAPYASFEFVNDFVFNGNVNLQRTLIDNYDVRLDWFLQPGEMISFSGFYKYFKNPIERVIDVRFSSEGALAFYDNVDRAEVFGLEFELRKSLDLINRTLRSFMFIGNLSLIKSEVTIPEESLQFRRALDPNAPDTRQLQGQSPFLANLNLVYQNLPGGTTATVYYNVFGKRLYEVSAGGTPDVFEQPRHTLNLAVDQKIGRLFSIKFSAKNLLDAKYKYVQEFKDGEFLRQQYSTGRSFSIGFNYER